MVYPRMLLHIDSHPRCARRVELAASLAHRFESQLIGIASLEDLDVNRWCTLALSSSPAEMTDRQARTKAALRRFEDYGRETLQHAPRGILAEESTVHAICRNAKFADLVILGQPEPEATETGRLLEGIQEIALRSPRPVLLAPCTSPVEQLGATIAIGWNGSHEVSRAIADALPLLSRAQRVVAVTINPPSSEYVEAPNDGMTLSDYLIHHGIKAETMLIRAPEQETTRHLLDACAQIGASMLVTGVRSSPVVNEWTIQGASADLFREARLPLFVSH